LFLSYDGSLDENLIALLMELVSATMQMEGHFY